MKKTVLVLAICLCASFAFAGQLEDLQGKYQLVLQELQQNLQTQQMLLNGFKMSNPTYMSLVKQQNKLQKQGKDLMKKIQEFNEPPPAPPAPQEDVGE